MTCKVIKTNGETQEVNPKNGKEFSLEELQGFVGGYVEKLNVNGKKVKQIIMNEEGLLMKLEPNLIVTELLSLEFGREVKTIVGDVLVIYN